MCTRLMDDPDLEAAPAGSAWMTHLPMKDFSDDPQLCYLEYYVDDAERAIWKREFGVEAEGKEKVADRDRFLPSHILF